METTPLNLTPNKSNNSTTRELVVKEMIDMERVYVGRLSIVVDNIINPLLGRGKEGEILSKSRVKDIFSNLEAILAFHKDMLSMLESASNFTKEKVSFSDGADMVRVMSDNVETKIAKIFNNSISKMQLIYGEYLKGYQRSTEVLEELLSGSEAFSGFIENALNKILTNETTNNNQSNLNDSNNDSNNNNNNNNISISITPSEKLTLPHLPSYLILPVQQLPRYRLILEELLKCCGTTEDSELFKVVENVKELASKVNEDIKTVKVLTPDNLTPSSSRPSSSSSIMSESSVSTSSSNLPPKTPSPNPKLKKSLSTGRLNLPESSPSSVPSYLRPTQASYSRSSEGRTKKDKMEYSMTSSQLWKPSGDPHSERIYNTAYNALDYTPGTYAHNFVDRPAGNLVWRHSSGPLRSFDDYSKLQPQSPDPRSTSASPRSPRLNPRRPMQPSTPENRNRKPLSPLTLSSALSPISLSTKKTSFSAPTTPRNHSASSTPRLFNLSFSRPKSQNNLLTPKQSVTPFLISKQASKKPPPSTTPSPYSQPRKSRQSKTPTPPQRSTSSNRYSLDSPYSLSKTPTSPLESRKTPIVDFYSLPKTPTREPESNTTSLSESDEAIGSPPLSISDLSPASSPIPSSFSPIELTSSLNKLELSLSDDKIKTPPNNNNNNNNTIITTSNSSNKNNEGASKVKISSTSEAPSSTEINDKKNNKHNSNSDNTKTPTASEIPSPPSKVLDYDPDETY